MTEPTRWRIRVGAHFARKTGHYWSLWSDREKGSTWDSAAEARIAQESAPERVRFEGVVEADPQDACRHEFQCEGWTVDHHTGVCRVCRRLFAFWSEPGDATSWSDLRPVPPDRAG